jgi:SAM-dependent methyltransferase
MKKMLKIIGKLKEVRKKHPFQVFRFLNKEVYGIVLDLGCGESSPIQYCKKVKFSVGIDINKEAILKSKKKIHNFYLISDVRRLPFVQKSFDCVLLLDLIEHLPKRDGFKLINFVEKIARKKIIVYTPNGFMPQLRDLEERNIYQKHLSGWNWSEMRKLGFSKIYGINGWKKFGNIKFKVVKISFAGLNKFFICIRSKA